MTAMTDLEAIALMFKRAGVRCEYESPTRADNAGVRPVPTGATIVTCRADPDTPNTYGYLGFFTALYFDADGALVGIGAWE